MNRRNQPEAITKQDVMRTKGTGSHNRLKTSCIIARKPLFARVETIVEVFVMVTVAAPSAGGVAVVVVVSTGLLGWIETMLVMTSLLLLLLLRLLQLVVVGTSDGTVVAKLSSTKPTTSPTT